MKQIIPNIWFDDNAEEAVNLYTSIFPNSKIGHKMYHTAESAAIAGKPAGALMTVDFEINGQRFVAINGGPYFKLSEAVSFLITTESQEETDKYYDALSAVPEAEQCGWLKDKFGLSWQVSPAEFETLIREGNPEGIQRMMDAMMPMKRLDIDALMKAYKGE